MSGLPAPAPAPAAPAPARKGRGWGLSQRLISVAFNGMLGLDSKDSPAPEWAHRLHRDCLKEARDLERELAGPDPTPVERLLVEQIVILWADCRRCEAMAMAHARLDRTPDRTAERWAALADRARRRYLHALATLARVRKLDLTVITSGPTQINVRPDA